MPLMHADPNISAYVDMLEKRIEALEEHTGIKAAEGKEEGAPAKAEAAPVKAEPAKTEAKSSDDDKKGSTTSGRGTRG